jgi:hypothetical protein
MKNMKDLEKMLMSEDKSDKEPSSEMMHKAKQEVLKELMDMCKMALMDKTGNDMEEMKKVTVMAPDSEKLSEGLDMAKELAGKMPEGKEEMMDEDKSEDPSKEMSSEDVKEDVAEGEDPMEETDHMPLFPGFKKKKI